MKTLSGLAIAVVVLFFGATFLLGSAAAPDPAAASTRCISETADRDVAGWSGEQLTNAATIIDVGVQLGVPDAGIVIAVMTAMGESSLRNLDHDDDAINADGTVADGAGLFQQQPQMGWGTPSQVRDPAYASAAFYGGAGGPNGGSPRGLLDVPGWQQLPPSHAAHAVQINSDRDHYARWLSDAQAVVLALTTACAGDGEWIVPAGGVITGRFGECGGIRPGRCHMGTDWADGTCNGPLWAASSGTVTRTYSTAAGGGTVEIDHGDGITTNYQHMWDPTTHVAAGDRVTTGQQIGLMGNAGNSYGCHLHFEVRMNGEAVNPETFLAERGVELRYRD